MPKDSLKGITKVFEEKTDTLIIYKPNRVWKVYSEPEIYLSVKLKGAAKNIYLAKDQKHELEKPIPILNFLVSLNYPEAKEAKEIAEYALKNIDASLCKKFKQGYIEVTKSVSFQCDKGPQHICVMLQLDAGQAKEFEAQLKKGCFPPIYFNTYGDDGLKTRKRLLDRVNAVKPVKKKSTRASKTSSYHSGNYPPSFYTTGIQFGAEGHKKKHSNKDAPSKDEKKAPAKNQGKSTAPSTHASSPLKP